jgi:peptidoglycan/LPS O-acetylase OafA/YrhL
LYQAALLERGPEGTSDAAPRRPQPCPAHANYLGLDLVRFWAACLVALYHLCYYWWNADPAPLAGDFKAQLAPLAPFTSPGWVGVQVFFVLSGLVIAASATGRAWPDFLRRRALRLYPAAWICGTMTALFCLASGEPHMLIRYVKSMALSPTGPWVDEVFWTLGLEIVFYAYIAAVLAAFGSHRLERAGLALGTASALYVLSNLVDLNTGGHFRGLLFPPQTEYGRLTLLRDGCYFGLGITLWAVADKGITPLRLVAAAVFTAAGLLVIERPAECAVWLASLSAIIVSIRYNAWIWQLLGRWSAQVRVLGLATFPLYLLHDEIGSGIMRVLHGIGAPAALAIALATVLGLSFLVTLVLEPKVRELLRRALAGGSGRAAAPARSGPVAALFVTLSLAAAAWAWTVPGRQVLVEQFAIGAGLGAGLLFATEALRRLRPRVVGLSGALQ